MHIIDILKFLNKLRQAEEEEDSTEKMMLDNFDDVANNEVENPEIVKEMSEEYDTEVEVKIKTDMNDEMVKDEMMKDEMSEVEGWGIFSFGIYMYCEKILRSHINEKMLL